MPEQFNPGTGILRAAGARGREEGDEAHGGRTEDAPDGEGADRQPRGRGREPDVSEYGDHGRETPRVTPGDVSRADT